MLTHRSPAHVRAGRHLCSRALPHLAADGPFDLSRATVTADPGDLGDFPRKVAELSLRLPFDVARCASDFRPPNS